MLLGEEQRVALLEVCHWRMRFGCFGYPSTSSSLSASCKWTRMWVSSQLPVPVAMPATSCCASLWGWTLIPLDIIPNKLFYMLPALWCFFRAWEKKLIQPSAVYSRKTPRGICFWNKEGIGYHLPPAYRNILYIKYTCVCMCVLLLTTQILEINQLL